jgi:hypothetical protein
MEGYVTKRGHLFKNWKVRWFHLNNGEIVYFKGNLLAVHRYLLLTADAMLTYSPWSCTSP